MKVLVTGSSGRVGRAVYIALMADFDVVGLDRQPSSTTQFVGDIQDEALLKRAFEGVDALIHCAALHAPHVGLVPDEDFQRVNELATQKLLELAIKNRVEQVVFTSTTALYGYASTPEDRAGWIDETVAPQPRTVYHRTKMQAEELLHHFSQEHAIPTTVLQMSRCFPEPADLMAVYRLNRGIEVRDVASAHRLALKKRLTGFHRFIISAKTPFRPEHCETLIRNADALIRDLVPELAEAFDRRGWTLPKKLDRVYDSRLAQEKLGWQPKYGFESVFQALDQDIPEVLKVI